MRRMLLIAIAGSAFAVALAVPGVALARHGHHHHRHHAKHARVLHFGSPPTAPTGPGPVAPSTQGPAGTVKSFTEGVLTITLADGTTTVSGKVTEETRLHCRSANPGAEEDQDDQGEDVGDDHARMADHGAQGGDDNGGDDNQVACTTSALTPGATVLDAELRVGGSGAVWEEVDILQ